MKPRTAIKLPPVERERPKTAINLNNLPPSPRQVAPHAFKGLQHEMHEKMSKLGPMPRGRRKL